MKKMKEMANLCAKELEGEHATALSTSVLLPSTRLFVLDEPKQPALILTLQNVHSLHLCTKNTNGFLTLPQNLQAFAIVCKLFAPRRDDVVPAASESDGRLQ